MFMKTAADFDIQGHRGARGLAPENTIPAFKKALELGTPTLEMDVVISRDDEVVVSHDPWFSRTICRLPDGRPIPFFQARSHRIYALTYEEVAAYDAGSLKHPRFPEQQLSSAPKPLLREVIRQSDIYAHDLGRDVPDFSIETKSRRMWEGRYHPDPETFVRLLVGVLDEEGVTDRSIVQSFDLRTLQATRRIDEDIRTSLLLTKRRAPRVEANLRRLGFTPTIYSPDQRAVTDRLVAEAHDHGMQVIPWTVNDPDRMRELKSFGCDGLITDYPDRAMPLR